MNLVIMPCAAGAVMTKNAIDSVLKQDIPVHILAIDNGSRDCAALLRAYAGMKGFTLISYHPQRSLNYVWNQALDTAFRSMKLNYALVINNDVVLPPHTYRMLLEDGGNFVTAVGVDKMERMYQPDPKSKSSHPDFSCFLIRKSVWEKVGGFEEEYWAYAADCSYHLRMYRAGIGPYCINVPYYHVGSGTIKHTDPKTSAMICKRADDDRETFRKQYGFTVGSPEYNAAFEKPVDS